MMHGPPTFLAEAVAREIADEQVLWADSPDPRAFARRCWPKNLIGIPFTAFAIFWTLGASGQLDTFKSRDGQHAPLFFTLWGCMFICIGLGILLSPIWARVRAKRIHYVLTPKRAIIFEKMLSLKVQSITGDTLRGRERVSFGSGSGDIIFRRTIIGSGRSRREEVVGFLCIEDVRHVEALLDSIYAQKT